MHRAVAPPSPSDARREVLAGASLAVCVAALVVGLVYALLALHGAFEDPSVPRTLGLVIFSLLHGGATSVSVPPVPISGDIGGSLKLGLPVTSFALLPFVGLLVGGRFFARGTGTPVLFALTTATVYAVIVGGLAAIGAASVEAGGGVEVRFAADPLSTAARGFLWAGLGALLGAAVPSGSLFLPEQARRVARGALAAVGVSLAVTLLLTIVLLLAQAPDVPGQPAQDGSPVGEAAAGEAAAGISVLSALLPAALGSLWLLANGLPLGLQGVPDLGGLPFFGPALVDVPLQVGLLKDWPFGDIWRLLLLGPVAGLVLGGAIAARGAPWGERWWRGALISVPYTALGAAIAVLCSVSVDANIAVVNIDVSIRASLPWLLLLLPVGGVLGALGGLLAKGDTAVAPNPRRTFVATVIASAVLLVPSLAGAAALPQETPELANTPSPGRDLPAATSLERERTAPPAPSAPPPSTTPERRGSEETDLRRAVEEYYEAVDRQDWAGTYDALDSRTRQRFTQDEWEEKNQFYADNFPLRRSSPVIVGGPERPSVPVRLTQTFENGDVQSRETFFVLEGGSWKHRLSPEELDLFMAGVPFERFAEAKAP